MGNCILSGYAWDDIPYACEGGSDDDGDGETPYNLWFCRHNRVVRKKAALKIVAACNKALRDLGKKKIAKKK